MSRSLIITLIAALAVLGAGYFWWRSQPEQKISRQLDDFVEAVAFEKISLKKREDRHTAFREIFWDKVRLTGESPIPQEDVTIKQILKHLDDLHSMITYLSLQEDERQISVSGDTATVVIPMEITAAAGPNYKRTERWQLEFHFEKLDRWRVIKLGGSRL